MANSRTAMTCSSITRLKEAKTLALELNIPFIEKKEQSKYDFLLNLTEHYLEILFFTTTKTRPDLLKSFHIDFLSKKINYRVLQASAKKEFLAKAIVIKPKFNPL